MVPTQTAWFGLVRKGEGKLFSLLWRMGVCGEVSFDSVTFPDGEHRLAIEGCRSQLVLSHTRKHTMVPQHQDSSLVTWSHTCWCSSHQPRPPPAKCGNRLKVWGGRCSPPGPACTACSCARLSPSCHLEEKQWWETLQWLVCLLLLGTLNVQQYH